MVVRVIHLAAYDASRSPGSTRSRRERWYLDETSLDHRRALYLVTLGVLVVFRLGVPIANAFRFRLAWPRSCRKATRSSRCASAGDRLDRPRTAGQFFLWRFSTRCW